MKPSCRKVTTVTIIDHIEYGDKVWVADKSKDWKTDILEDILGHVQQQPQQNEKKTYEGTNQKGQA